MYSRSFLSCFVLVSFFMLVAVPLVTAGSVPRMSTDELYSRLGDADLVVLDVRGSWDYDPATSKISGSERVEPRSVGQWIGNYPKESTIVLYCA